MKKQDIWQEILDGLPKEVAISAIKDRYGEVFNLMDGLPSWCFAKRYDNKTLVIVTHRVSGFYPLPCHIDSDSLNEYNEAIGVTKRQAQCMQIGSMFGWDVPGADLEHAIHTR